MRVPTGGSGSAYAKFHRRAIDWSIVGAAVAIRDGRVQVALQVDPARGAALEPLRAAAERAVAKIKGVAQAQVALTAEKPAPQSGRRAGPSREARCGPPPRRTRA